MFFEIGSDSILFDGLEILSEKELCEEYMGKFPGISITLKGVAGRTFDEAKSMLRRNYWQRGTKISASDGE